MKWKYLFLVSLFLISLAFCILYFSYSIHITFLSKEELFQHLKRNEDGYFNTFHENDFRVRNVSTIQEYYIEIQKCVSDPSKEIQEKIKSCIYLIHEELTARQKYHGIDVHTFLAIPWKIGFTQGKGYENGFPHTRGNVIVLNTSITEMSEKSLCRLLIHEKVHVYQKLYPQEMSIYLATKQIVPIRKRDYSDKTIPANPDLDQHMYNGYGAFYDKTPTAFKDLRYLHDSSASEHPLEEMAYQWEKVF